MPTNGGSTQKIHDDFTSLPLTRQRKYQLRNMRRGMCIICGGEAFQGTIFCLEDNTKRGILVPGKNGGRSRKWLTGGENGTATSPDPE
jgi:hypothetical protein